MQIEHEIAGMEDKIKTQIGSMNKWITRYLHLFEENTLRRKFSFAFVCKKEFFRIINKHFSWK